MSVLSNSQTKTLSAFATDEGGQMILGHFKIIQAIAELAGVSGVPTTAGPLPTPPALVAVDPAVGAVGLITLPTFTDGDPVLTAPTTAPPFHGARSMTLHAPKGNAGIVYYSQFANVRPADSSTSWLDGQFINESSFAAVGDWEGVAVDEWEISGGTASFTLNGTGGAGSIPLSQAVADLPAGVYRLTVDINAIAANAGATDASLLVSIDNGTTTEAFITAGTSTADFTHAGGTANVRLDFQWEGDGDVAVELNSAVLQRVRAPEPFVGTPLQPGETIILTGRDLDLTRPLYIVGTVGEATEQVIVNYLN